MVVVVGSGLIFGMGRSNRGCGVQPAICVVRSISCPGVAEILEMMSGTGLHGILVSSTSYLLTSHSAHFGVVCVQQIHYVSH